ncbi:MAG: ATP-binding cassette domain-containing protein [Actinomycetota bacterium]|nr:ATP-binding cassette domain-containing protein [Actinomycetota bacterium]
MISLHGTVVAGEFSRHFDLEIGNEIVGVVGQNGTGKTSLLRTIAGLSALGSGELSLNGVMVDQPAKRLFVLPELRNIGMVFQDHALMPFLSAVDNAALPLVVRGMKRGEAKTLALELLEQFGVADVAYQLSSTLSGGQSQRVAIARALIGTPSVILLDEPLSAIDEESRNGVRLCIREHLNRLGVSALVVSHDFADIDQICTRIENYTR